MIQDYIDSLLHSTPEHPLWNQEWIRQNKKAGWNYIDGCMMTAFLSLYDKKRERKYLDFVKNYIDYFIQDDGSIKTYCEEEYNLDNINEGRVLFRLYDEFGEERYRKAIETLYTQLQNQPRTKEGNFWHKKIYPHQVWLDGLYMAQPFYLEYEKRFNSRKNYGDILRQFLNTEKYLKDQETGLYYHAYDSSRKMYWCDPETGRSPHFWLRAMGWYYMALVDVLEILDSEDKYRGSYIRLFQDLTLALLKYQDDSGMWYQIIDKAHIPPNYPETSGSAIIAYALFKAVRLNILPAEIRGRAEKAFKGISEKYLTVREEEISLGGTCLVAGLGGKEERDGSFRYYMSEPVVENEAKGIAPFILAYIYTLN
ncbi:MAG: glycoside hydrolase family 88 protein [Spirochaetales bacterium]|nr:glycoside hydrolase family 88 protein [Spirochaetales bacterium]